jgi:hypothetical protein
MGLVAQKRWITEGAHCRITSFVGIHASGEIFFDLAIEVEAEFVVEVGAGSAAREEHPDAHRQLIEPTHVDLLRMILCYPALSPGKGERVGRGASRLPPYSLFPVFVMLHSRPG